MNRTEENGLGGKKTLEQESERPAGNEPPPASHKLPYIPAKNTPKPSLREHAGLFVIGGGIVLVLILLALSGISRNSRPAQKSVLASGKQQQSKQQEDGSRATTSITPIMDAGRSAEREPDGSLVNPDQIVRTTNKQPKQSAPMNLGSIPPFDHQASWAPAPYQPGSEAPTLVDGATTGGTNDARRERDSFDKASLVFVRNKPSSATSPKSQDVTPVTGLGIGLAPGTRLRARLESAVSTAVQTPVVAVIEYNYEQDGEIAVPAGAKAFGHLDAADRSGYLGIRFDSLLMPDGSNLGLEAAATDLQLRPVRGKVEGKHAGKNLLVRSFAGVGEIAATLVGRGSLNQPLSESDLLRERVSNNIGQASDQEVANSAITERVVVSVSADTEIYVVLQKPARETSRSSRTQLPAQAATQPGIEELRQLLQLQRELSDTPVTKGPTQ